MYEPTSTGGANINMQMLLSEMFNFPTPAADLLANQISDAAANCRLPMRRPAGFSCSNRQGSNFLSSSSIGDAGAAVLLKHHPDDERQHQHQHLIQGLNADDSAAAIQLQQHHQRSPPDPTPRLHHHQKPHAHAFHTSTASFGGAVVLQSQGQGQGQGLSLSLSSSWQPFELAKAGEELGARDIEALYFKNPHHAPPPQQKHHLPSLRFQGQPSEGSQHVQMEMGYDPMGVVNLIRNSRYARPAQELLEEICSVGRGDLKGSRIGKHPRTSNPNPSCGSGGGAPNSVVCPSSSSKDLTPADKFEFEHHRNKAKLFSMLDEVDRRYKHYCEQMQMVVQSFDSVMGFVGASTAYTSLAQKAMSRHFRCLKEVIAAQLKQTCEFLGETKGETPSPRLRLLDQGLRQQRAAFHQMGMMEQEAWRPQSQRGLPERSVTILRVWLFDHFLHPYPSDADKHLLARQTGLSRNQVCLRTVPPQLKRGQLFGNP